MPDNPKTNWITELTAARLLTDLWSHLSARRRLDFAVLLALMIGSSVAEIASLSLLLPFLLVLGSGAELAMQGEPGRIMASLIEASGVDARILVAIAFILAVIVSGVIRLLVLNKTTKFSFVFGAELGRTVYRKVLSQNYMFHVRNNSGDIINSIVNKTVGVSANIVAQALVVLTSVFMIAGVGAVIISVDAAVAIFVAVIFGASYFVILMLVGRSLRKNGDVIARQSTTAIKVLQEGLGSIRDVIIDGTSEQYVEAYGVADRQYKAAVASNNIIAATPRYLLEMIGMVLVAGVALFLTSASEDGLVAALPILALLAMAAQRLLPSLQQAYAAITVIRGNLAPLEDVLNLLRLPEDSASGVEHLSFANAIEWKRVSFYYDNGRSVLDSISLRIPRGSRVGVVGVTGSGKSTFLDLLMGLIDPTEGTIDIDGVVLGPATRRAWQRHIAHVPQSVFLADTSVRENIAFGVPGDKVDMSRVRRAAEVAQIAKVIESWPAGYNTAVGERGGRLSGGQRQRIGVARALYKDADVLILDEATSALDFETERALIEGIQLLSPDITIVIVSHRRETLTNCDMILRIREGVAEIVANA